MESATNVIDWVKVMQEKSDTLNMWIIGRKVNVMDVKTVQSYLNVLKAILWPKLPNLLVCKSL